MFYLSDAQLDQLLMEDIQYGDLTTRALGIGQLQGKMTVIRKDAGRVSGLKIAEKLLKKLYVDVFICAEDGKDVTAQTLLLTATGPAGQLHQGWKVVQNVLEWSCGVAQYMAEMMAEAVTIQPGIKIACTRKSIPGTKFLAIPAVLDGGGILHRGGTAETILLFTNHRCFCANPDDWGVQISALRCEAPEKKIIVEADSPEDAISALNAKPDILQLDKFTPAQLRTTLNYAKRLAPQCLLSAAGGITCRNVREYAQTGVTLLVTSSPYYAPPADIKVSLFPV